QDHQHACAVGARERVALTRLEAEQSAGPELDIFRARRHLDAPVQHDDPRVLLHLMVAECLAAVDRDQHCARTLVLMDDVRIARAARRVDRMQIPVLHGPDLDTAEHLDSPAWSCPSTASCSTRATRPTAG